MLDLLTGEIYLKEGHTKRVEVVLNSFWTVQHRIEDGRGHAQAVVAFVECMQFRE